MPKKSTALAKKNEIILNDVEARFLECWLSPVNQCSTHKIDEVAKQLDIPMLDVCKLLTRKHVLKAIAERESYLDSIPDNQRIDIGYINKWLKRLIEGTGTNADIRRRAIRDAAEINGLLKYDSNYMIKVEAIANRYGLLPQEIETKAVALLNETNANENVIDAEVTEDTSTNKEEK